MALLLGIVLSTVVLMVLGELVPKNWAISRPLRSPRSSQPRCTTSAAFAPLIAHLNNTANRFVRRRGLEPAEHLGGPRTPQELVALARHSSKAGTLDPGTAEMFVRALRLRHLTAQHVMTPRVDVKGLNSGATVPDVVDLTVSLDVAVPRVLRQPRPDRWRHPPEARSLFRPTDGPPSP